MVGAAPIESICEKIIDGIVERANSEVDVAIIVAVGLDVYIFEAVDEDLIGMTVEAGAIDRSFVLEIGGSGALESDNSAVDVAIIVAMRLFGIEAGEEDRVVIAKPGVAIESIESSVVKGEAGSDSMGSFVIVVPSGRASEVRIHESIKLDD